MIHAVKKKKKIELHVGIDLAKTLFGFASWLVFSGIVIVSLLFYAALFSYSVDDPAWTNATGNVEIQNWMGAFGANAAAIGYMLFGKLVNILPIILCVCFYYLLIKSVNYKFSIDTLAIKLVVLLVCIAVGSGLLQTALGIDSGVIGDVMGKNLILSLNKLLPFISIDALWYCIILILAVLFFIGLMILTGVTPLYWADIIGKYCISFGMFIYTFLSKFISLDKHKKINAAESSFNLNHLMEKGVASEVKSSPSQVAIQEPIFSNNISGNNFNTGFDENFDDGLKEKFDNSLSSYQNYAETQVLQDVNAVENISLSLNQNEQHEQHDFLDFGSHAEYIEVSPETLPFTAHCVDSNYAQNESVDNESLDDVNVDLVVSHENTSDLFDPIGHFQNKYDSFCA